MQEEKELELTNTFTRLYKKHHPLYPDNVPMSFSFECGDGWYQLLKDLSAKLEEEIAKQKNPDDFFAVQVKEKFGGLRFYMSSETEEMSKFIDEAEKVADVTCEICGKPGTLRTEGWMRTLCDACEERRKSR